MQEPNLQPQPVPKAKRLQFRRPVVDYREFRLSKLTDPRFSHLLYLGGWLLYFLLYFVTEHMIPLDRFKPVRIPLDDLIPFCEWFVIPYTFWYLMIVFEFAWFMLYDIDSFKKLCTFTTIVQVLACVIYVVYPNYQELRPETFPRENLLTWIIGLIYSFDTSRGVLPSLHCGVCIAMASAWTHPKENPLWSKVVFWVLTALVCLSTVFIKQHSALDFFAVLPLCLIGEVVVYHVIPWWKKKRHAQLP